MRLLSPASGRGSAPPAWRERRSPAKKLLHDVVQRLAALLARGIIRRGVGRVVTALAAIQPLLDQIADGRAETVEAVAAFRVDAGDVGIDARLGPGSLDHHGDAESDSVGAAPRSEERRV